MWRLLICRLFHPRFCSDGSVPPGAPVTAGPLQQNTCVWQVNRFHLSSWIICGDHPSYVYTGVIDWGRGSVGQAGRVCRTCLFYSLVSTANVIVCEHTNLFHSTIFFRIWTKNSEQTKFSIGCTQPQFHKCWDAAWIIKKKKREKKRKFAMWHLYLNLMTTAILSLRCSNSGFFVVIACLSGLPLT